MRLFLLPACLLLCAPSSAKPPSGGDPAEAEEAAKKDQVDKDGERPEQAAEAAKGDLADPKDAEMRKGDGMDEALLRKLEAVEAKKKLAPDTPPEKLLKAGGKSDGLKKPEPAGRVKAGGPKDAGGKARAMGAPAPTPEGGPGYDAGEEAVDDSGDDAPTDSGAGSEVFTGKSRPQDVVPPKTTGPSVQSVGSRAVDRAKRMEDVLRRSFSPSTEGQGPDAQVKKEFGGFPAAELPGDRTPAANGSNLRALGLGAAPPGKEGPGGNPANPVSKQDLVLSAGSGYGEAFKALGLSVQPRPGGAPEIVHRGGKPASEAELKELGALIRSEPEALMKRPDFYSVLPRERFLDLKEDYRSQPAARQAGFLHIGMSAGDRDFLRSASCSPVSGDACNPHATQLPYAKGEFVPPEDLDKIWEALNSGEEDESFDLGEFTPEQKRQLALLEEAEKNLGRSAFGSKSGIMDKVRAAAASWLGTRPGSSDGVSAGSGGLGPGSRGGAPPGSAAGQGASSAGTRGKAGGPGRGDETPRRPAWLWWAMAAGAALVAVGLKLRRPRTRVETEES